MFQLSVYYDLERGDDNRLLWRDDEIEEIAGVPSVSSGCAMECMTRDIQLRFETEEALKAAKIKLRDAGFRFAAMCGVHPSE